MAEQAKRAIVELNGRFIGKKPIVVMLHIKKEQRRVQKQEMKETLGKTSLFLSPSLWLGLELRPRQNLFVHWLRTFSFFLKVSLDDNDITLTPPYSNPYSPLL
jgi:hypothetical protein